MYSIPEKTVKLVKVMYSGSECAVIDDSNVCNWFEIKTSEPLLSKSSSNWKFISHVLRMDTKTEPWAPEGRSSVRPKETWWRTTEKERTALSFVS